MYDTYNLDQVPYGEWKSDQSNQCSSTRGQRQIEFPRGQSRTIYLPAERTGAVIGKNGRMKHLIKVGPKILRLQFDPENKCDFQEILIFDFSDVDFQELMSANILVSHFEKIVCMLIQHSFIGNNGQLCITGGAISPNVLKSPNLTYAISRF